MLGGTCVSGTAIRQTPFSIVVLKNLKKLSFKDCGGKSPTLWSSIFSSVWFPKISANSMSLLLPPLSSLSSLTVLNLSNCNLLDGLVPGDIGCLSSLKILDLSENEFFTLPSSISQLSNLKHLHPESCKRLQSLPELPGNVQFVGGDDCIELKHFRNLQKLFVSTHSKFNLFNWYKLVDQLDFSSPAWTLLKAFLQASPNSSYGFEVCLPGSAIPKWLTHQSTGSSVSIDLLPHWNNSDLMGFVMCAVFRLRRSVAVTRPCNDTEPPYQKLKRIILSCSFTNDQGEHLIDNLQGAYFPHCFLQRKCTYIGSDHIWLLYRRSQLEIDLLNELDRLTLSFFHQYGSDWDIEVRKCALQLVYAQDVLELHSISCSLHENMNKWSNDCYNARTEKAPIELENPHDASEPGESSSAEEPQAKRLKKL